MYLAYRQDPDCGHSTKHGKLYLLEMVPTVFPIPYTLIEPSTPHQKEESSLSPQVGYCDCLNRKSMMETEL